MYWKWVFKSFPFSHYWWMFDPSESVKHAPVVSALFTDLYLLLLPSLHMEHTQYTQQMLRCPFPLVDWISWQRWFSDNLRKCVLGKEGHFSLELLLLPVIGASLRERAPLGMDCCMIISCSAGGKREQKSLRDREGPHRSPVDLFDSTLLSAQSLFIQPLPGGYYKCVCLCVRTVDLWTHILAFSQATYH